MSPAARSPSLCSTTRPLRNRAISRDLNGPGRAVAPRSPAATICRDRPNAGALIGDSFQLASEGTGVSGLAPRRTPAHTAQHAPPTSRRTPAAPSPRKPRARAPHPDGDGTEGHRRRPVAVRQPHPQPRPAQVRRDDHPQRPVGQRLGQADPARARPPRDHPVRDPACHRPALQGRDPRAMPPATDENRDDDRREHGDRRDGDQAQAATTRRQPPRTPPPGAAPLPRSRPG